MQYHSTVGIFWFDVHENPHKANPTVLIKGGSMDDAKHKAHQRATALGLKPEGKWQHATENYATRSYRTAHGARRLVVVERS